MINEIFVYVFKKHELADFGMIEHKFWYFFHIQLQVWKIAVP